MKYFGTPYKADNQTHQEPWLQNCLSQGVQQKRKLRKNLGKQSIIFAADLPRFVFQTSLIIDFIIIKIHESRAGAPVNLLSVREKVSKAAKSSQISVPASPNAFKTVGLFSKNKNINALDQVPTNYRNLKQLVCNVLTLDPLLTFQLTLLNLPRNLHPLRRRCNSPSRN